MRDDGDRKGNAVIFALGKVKVHQPISNRASNCHFHLKEKQLGRFAIQLFIPIKFNG